MKLHLGCGDVLLAGWVNIDIESDLADAKLDITSGLPYEDGSVSHIFAEHVIEHVTLEQARSLLAECRRVLSPNGVIRISTPDLRWLAHVYISGLTHLWGDIWQPESPCKLINEGMRSWGHQFLYDADELVALLRASGFPTVKRQNWHVSDHSELNGLESRPYHNDLIFEASPSDEDLGSKTSSVEEGGSGYSVPSISPLLVEQASVIESTRLELEESRGELGRLQRLLAGADAERQGIEERNAGVVRDLSGSLEDRERHIVGLEAGMEERRRHIEGLEAAVRELEEGRRIDLEAMRFQREASQAALLQQSAEYSTLLAGLDSSLRAVTTALSERDAEVRNLNVAAKEADKQVLSQQVTLASKVQELEHLLLESGTQQSRIASLEEELKSARANAEELQCALDRSREAVAETKESFDRERARCTSLEARVQSALLENDKKDKLLARLTMELDEQKVAMQKKSEEIESASSALSDAELHLNELGRSWVGRLISRSARNRLINSRERQR